MIHDVTLSILPARARARVPALVSQAGLVPGTLRVQYTLRATCFVRVTAVLWDTLAHTAGATHCIRPARGRVARVNGLWRGCNTSRSWFTLLVVNRSSIVRNCNFTMLVS